MLAAEFIGLIFVVVVAIALSIFVVVYEKKSAQRRDDDFVKRCRSFLRTMEFEERLLGPNFMIKDK